MLSNWLKSAKQMQAIQPLRSRLLSDPYYRFRSIAEIQLAAQLGLYIDANRAGVDDWLRLPGLSIHQARSLVALVQSGVQFHCLDDVAAALGIPVQQLQLVAPILKFCYYDAESLDHIQPVNPNFASIEQLTRVPKIDLFLAKAIWSDRQKHGTYQSIAHFQQRLALPAELISHLMHYLRI